MSILQFKDNIQSVTTIEDLVRMMYSFFKDLLRVVNGNLNFVENIQGQYVSITFTNTSDDFPLLHNLGHTATGYLVVKRSTNMSIYDGVSAWDSTRVFLKSSAKGTALVFIF